MTPSRRSSRRLGRFAPSPTGPLHFGSLVAAVGSFADARAGGGAWLVRMEDLDRTRELPGAADAILRTLEAFGLHWDGAVLYQRTRTDAYAAALARLGALGFTYSCGCSRREIALGGRTGPEGPIYPGTCRGGLPPGRPPRSIRLRVGDARIGFADQVQGPQFQDLAAAVGDFVLRRADGIHAYQLAVVVDDAEQGVTDVVRGADLLLSTPRQILLQRRLGLPQPTYAHLPLAVDAAGRKLSKSHAALPVDARDPLPALLRAWRFLGQPKPPERPGDVAGFWMWALANWNRARVPTCANRPGADVIRP
ncbi:MAG: tRNA glutamyl-Q(34) synthetase GluQRS [Thiohalocapsa sp.]|uniref:tRNA glutamyl-Q(34) synthetase GluQRS n=1 Tax=Thiohalocapsa sp. TaxID=2497641 RepID=UPI0025D0E4EB|nr:tRNA glutamyl-Q(34) synthetase GluQRS [Thiohalocapsa sp.]MCG6940108.1 tRNA glutamyl-Q(34) synthetase GluQRS [Thiohalocapsa sp.]